MAEFSPRARDLSGALESSRAAMLNTHVGTTPKRGVNQYWTPRLAEIEQDAQAFGRNVDAVFLGESHAHFFDKNVLINTLAGARTQAGATIWDGWYGKRRVISAAIGGSETGHLLYQIMHSGVLGRMQPDPALIVLMTGTNNMIAGHTAQQTSDGIVACVDMIRRSSPESRILYVTPPPPEATAGTLRAAMDSLHDIISVHPIFDGVFSSYLDLRAFFVGDGSGSGNPATDAHVAGFFAPGDNVHLTQVGYQQLASVLDASLRARVPAWTAAPSTPQFLFPAGQVATNGSSVNVASQTLVAGMTGFACVATRTAASTTPQYASGATWNSQAMSLVGQETVNDGTGNITVQMFRIHSAAGGTGNVIATLTGSQSSAGMIWVSASSVANAAAEATASTTGTVLPIQGEIASLGRSLQLDVMAHARVDATAAPETSPHPIEGLRNTELLTLRQSSGSALSLGVSSRIAIRRGTGVMGWTEKTPTAPDISAQLRASFRSL